MSSYILMGVSGCGKTTIGEALAARLQGIFLDGDDFHPAANIAKMHAGIPLSDDDRWGWLDALNLELKKREAADETVVLACSALRQAYRDKLSAGLPTPRFIYLRGTKEEIAERLRQRHGHFMPASLLDSQFATLEEPTDAIVVDISHPVEENVESALRQIRGSRQPAQ